MTTASARHLGARRAWASVALLACAAIATPRVLPTPTPAEVVVVDAGPVPDEWEIQARLNRKDKAGAVAGLGQQRNAAVARKAWGDWLHAFVEQVRILSDTEWKDGRPTQDLSAAIRFVEESTRPGAC